MTKLILKSTAIIFFLVLSSLSYSQSKFTYKPKYRFTPSDNLNLFTFGYTYNQTLNTNDFSIGAMKGRIDFLNIYLIGGSYSKQSLIPGSTEVYSFFSGPWGINKSIFTRQNLNVLGNANLTARYLFIDAEDYTGEKFIVSGELSLTFETSNFSCDIGYNLSSKNLTVPFEDNNYNYNNNSFDMNIKNPYYGFFIRFNIDLVGDGVHNSSSCVGTKKIRLPNPKLSLKYNFHNSPIEAGQKESIVINASNNGEGSAEGVWLKINSTNTDIFSFQKSYYIGYIPSNSSKDITIPITTSENIYSKKNVKIDFSLEEKDGFKANTSLNLIAIPQKPVLPPNLLIPSSSIRLIGNNNVLESSEKSSIKFKLQNKGNGKAVGLKLKITPQNFDGITLETERNIGNLDPNKELELTIPIETNYNTKDGKCKLTFFIQEINGFNSDPMTIEIPTAQFQPPNVLVTDYVISTTNNQAPKLGVPINLKFSIQNIGQTSAKDIIIDCNAPKDVFFSTKNSFTINELKPNESKIFELEFFANKLYAVNEVPINITIKESFGKYAQNKIVNVSLNTNQASTSIILDGKVPTHDIKIAGLRPDVDINIPVNKINSSNTYALIIGNEDYSSRQSGLNKEIDVVYAKNDAAIFKTYLKETYGVPENNINIQLDATSTEIKQGLDKLGKIASLVGSKSNFIIFYAGHGISDNIAREPYIIPVDVNASNLDYAIKLKDFTSIFEKYPVKRATIILDACFSGFGRNQGLIETRGVRVKPKYANIPENTTIISSSSEVEPSLPYDTKNHGLFTYYLLKKIQETNGSVKLSELFDYLKENVTIQSILIKNQQQTPSIISGNDIDGKWKNLRLVE